jgi:streptogrisin D
MPGGGHELRPGHRSVNNKKKAMWAGAAAMAVAAVAIIWPQANASQTPAAPKKLSAAAASELAAQVASQLGSAYAGVYYDADKQQMTVNVAGVDNDAMARVRNAGAEARQVRNSAATLNSGAAKLRQQVRIAGTALAVDPRTNQIVVTADRTVTAANWDRLVSSARSLGDGVARVQRSTAVFRLFVDGGDAIFGGNARCSLGFNVTTQDGSPGFLTAGHCGVAEPEWSDSPNGAPIATIQDATFPGDGDFALATYDDPDTEAASVVDVGNGQLVQINQAAEAVVGQQVFRMGSTTGLNDGTITGLDATVTYPEGTVTGLIQTDVCAEPGDSGGPLFTENGGAVGLTSGGSGNCTVGGETFFQPVTTALEAVGATIGAE